MAKVPQKDRETVHALVVPSTKVFVDTFTGRHGLSTTGLVEALLVDLSEADRPHVDAIIERARGIDYERRQRERTKQRA